MFTETTRQFEGATVIVFDEDGELVRYAMRRDANGNLMGNKYVLQEKLNIPGATEATWVNSGSSTNAESDNPNLRIGPVYQMHEDALSEMEEVLAQLNITV